MATITSLDVIDIRFPTSRTLDGSDAMNPDPDYSAAYVILRTDAADGPEGHGLTFTIGRGTEVVVAGVRALRPLVVGRSTDELFADMGAFWRDARRRQPAALDRPREGRHPPRHGGRRQRGLGPLREGGGEAALEAARRHDARGTRRADRLSLHHRRPPAGAGARTARARLPPRARPARPSSGGTAIPPTRRRSAGSATTTTRSGGSAARRWPTAGRAFKLKVGADVEDDRRRARIVREEIGPDTMMARRRQSALGRRRGDRLDGGARRVRSVLDRGADEPRRHPRPRGDRPGRRADPRRDRRARPQPGHVQAVPPGRCAVDLPDRRLPDSAG